LSASGGAKQNAAHARHVMQCGNAASHENEACWRHQACRGEAAGDCRRTLSDDRRWKSGDVDLNGDSLRAASSRRRRHEPYWLSRAAHPRKCRCAPLEHSRKVVARRRRAHRCAWASIRLTCSTNRSSLGGAAIRRIALRERQTSGVKIYAWNAVQSLRFALVRTRPGGLRSRLIRTPSARKVSRPGSPPSCGYRPGRAAPRG